MNSNQIVHNDKDPQALVVVGPTNPRWLTVAILKMEKLLWRQ